MTNHSATITAAVPAQPATRRAGSASWRRMLSTSPPSWRGSARVVQSTVSGSVASCGRAAGGADRVSTPTELDGEYAIEEPPDSTGSGAGDDGGVCCAGGGDGGVGSGATGAKGAGVRTAGRRLRSPATSGAASITTPAGGPPRRPRTSWTCSAALTVVLPVRQATTTMSTIQTSSDVSCTESGGASRMTKSASMRARATKSCWRASRAAGFSVWRPAPTRRTPGTAVGTATWSSVAAPSSTSLSPGPGSTPRWPWASGARMSQSMTSADLPVSATTAARFTAVVVLPSPLLAEVTRADVSSSPVPRPVPCRVGGRPRRASAVRRSRNASAAGDNGWTAATTPPPSMAGTSARTGRSNARSTALRLRRRPSIRSTTRAMAQPRNARTKAASIHPRTVVGARRLCSIVVAGTPPTWVSACCLGRARLLATVSWRSLPWEAT